MKPTTSLLLAGLGSTALMLSSLAQTGASGATGSTGSSTGSTATSSTSTTATGLPTVNTNNGLPTATSTNAAPSTLPAPVNTQPTAINNQPTTLDNRPTTNAATPESTLPNATGTPTTSTFSTSSTSSTTMPGSATGLNTTTTNGGAISPGTVPIGPQPISTPGSTMQDLRSANPSVDTRPSFDPGVNRSDVTLNGATRPADAAQLSNGNPVVVPTAPPEAVPETQPTRADPNTVWVSGHYTFTGGQWVWVSGAWATPPRAGATWVPGFYDPGTRRWTEGHWSAESGGTTVRP